MNTQLKPTHQYLNITPQEYETRRFKQYYLWCENLAENHKVDVQILIANRAIANYYSDQFLELEHSFKIIAERLYGLVDSDIMNENYLLVMLNIHLNYPKPLIEAAKSLKIINNLSQN